jgi:WD40 repeat protein
VGAWDVADQLFETPSLRAPAHVLVGHQGEVSGVSWHRSGTFAVTCGDDCTVRMWAYQV